MPQIVPDPLIRAAVCCRNIAVCRGDVAVILLLSRCFPLFFAAVIPLFLRAEI
jgi:hypothetical protein